MSDFHPSDTRLLYALRRASVSVDARKQAALGSLGLSAAQYAVLISVWAHPGTTGAELARGLGVSPQNVANLVARLLRRGLVSRTPHASHASVLELRLTDEGQAALVVADGEVARLEAALVAALGAAAAGTATSILSAIADQPVDSHHRVDLE